MASVNLTTGKISGCEPGSKTYWHELGHLKFEEEFKYGSLVRNLQNIGTRFLIVLTGLFCIYPLFFFKYLILICIITTILAEVYEERWCWNYAKEKNKEQQV